MSEEKNYSIKSNSNNTTLKLSKKIFFLYIGIYIIPFFVSWVTLVQLHIFDIKETLIGFTSPVAIFGMA